MSLFICPKCFHEFEYWDDEPSGEETLAYCPECDFEVIGKIECLGYDCKQETDDLIDQFISIHNIDDFPSATYPIQCWFEQFIKGDFSYGIHPDKIYWQIKYKEIWEFRHRFPKYKTWRNSQITQCKAKIENGTDYMKPFYQHYLNLLEQEICLSPVNIYAWKEEVKSKGRG